MSARGSPTLQVDNGAGLSIAIESEWSSRFQQFLTEKRLPSFVEVAGTRLGGSLCDVLSLGRSADAARVENALADWARAFPATASP